MGYDVLSTLEVLPTLDAFYPPLPFQPHDTIPVQLSPVPHQSRSSKAWGNGKAKTMDLELM